MKLFKVGRSYRTIDDHRAKILLRKPNGNLVIEINGTVTEVLPDGKIPKRMICNYASDGPSAYTLTGEEWRD